MRPVDQREHSKGAVKGRADCKLGRVVQSPIKLTQD